MPITEKLHMSSACVETQIKELQINSMNTSGYLKLFSQALKHSKAKDMLYINFHGFYFYEKLFSL
jgi:hypothetical protein